MRPHSETLANAVDGIDAQGSNEGRRRPTSEHLEELPVRPLAELRQRTSAKWRRQPDDVIPLTVAETDFDLAPAVAVALSDALGRSDTGYAHPADDLAAALAHFTFDRWSWEVDPERVTAAPDVGVAAVELLRLFASGGSPVVICPPIYPPFYSWIKEAGSAAIEVPLLSEGWRLDMAQLERVFACGPAVFMLCNPHNPVGRVHTREELTQLVRLARAHRVTVISDEIHAPLVLPGATFTPLLDVDDAGEIAVSVHSASKAWNLAGLKYAAIITASQPMHSAIARLPQDLGSRVGHLGAIATQAAYSDTSDWLDRLLTTVQHRRDFLGHLLRTRLPSLRWQPPEATYLAWIDATVLGLGNRPCERFLRHSRVGLQPGTTFGSNPDTGFVRLNFATSTDILDLATARMTEATLHDT